MLTFADVCEIRLRYSRQSPPVSQRQLATEFHVNRSTIQDILAGRTWKVDQPERRAHIAATYAGERTPEQLAADIKAWTCAKCRAMHAPEAPCVP